MNSQASDSRSGQAAPQMMWGLLVATLVLLAGCSSTPDADEVVPLPGFASEGPEKPKGVYAVIRRADVPLDESTDDAWSIINEQVVPPVTRGIWRGNGLRVGLLQRDQLDPYSEAMPQPVAFGRVLINRSVNPVPIVETPRLRSDLRLDVDLTRPPKPLAIEQVRGGEQSTLRLLARIETDAQGQHTLVLTPQHYIPSPLTLIPRDPVEKELDGRVYDELSLRIRLGQDQIAVIGLHWPWPMGEVLDEDEDPDTVTPADRVSLRTSTAVLAADPNDPAAPPEHVRLVEDEENRGEQDDPDRVQTDPADSEETLLPEPRVERIAPPLTPSLGSTLLTGTRIRQPVRTVLLITIEEPAAQQQDAPEIAPVDFDELD